MHRRYISAGKPPPDSVSKVIKTRLYKNAKPGFVFQSPGVKELFSFLDRVIL
jgi:hypothetical protein